MKKTAKLILTASILVTAAAAFSPALSAEPCAVCHRYAGLAAEGRDFSVGSENAAKTHGALHCSDCHKGYLAYPHGKTGETRCDLPCHVPGANHEAVMTAVKAGPHGKKTSKSENACVTCHLETMTSEGGAKARPCEDCHGKMDSAPGTFPGGPGSFGRRAHAGAEGAPSCAGCHGTHKADRETARASCGNPGCHPGKPEGFAALYTHGDREKDGGSGKAFSWALLALLSLVLAANWARGPK